MYNNYDGKERYYREQANGKLYVVCDNDLEKYAYTVYNNGIPLRHFNSRWEAQEYIRNKQ